MPRAAKPLWTCPNCGHRFVTRNIYHTCARYSLDEHFNATYPAARLLYESFLGVIERNGPVTVIPQKTRISIQMRIRFASVYVRRKWIVAALILTREAEHRCLQRMESFAPRCHEHHFKLQNPEDLDEHFAALVKESYAVGCQEHLRKGN